MAPKTPLNMDSVIVFGDSLSDIGKKWLTKSGRLARFTNQMHVSPSGRFSDCRNWTDFMYEAATGETLIVGTAAETVAKSAHHTSYGKDSEVDDFQYANYAEGGACGDHPASKARFLGTFKDQVDAFKIDCKALGRPLGNTLFIVWFGANDLYTAGRAPAQMDQVATQIASTQRNRLVSIFHEQNNATTLQTGQKFEYRFIFVDLCRPLTSVRYAMRLKKAEDKVKARLGDDYSDDEAKPRPSRLRAENTLEQAGRGGVLPNRWGRANAAERLRRQIEEIKGFEKGVEIFNARLAGIADSSGDQVAKIGTCISEDTVEQLLIRRDYGLRLGAMTDEAEHVSASSRDKTGQPAPLTTIDEAHPTDQMYRLIWWEIYAQMKLSACTFGKLAPVGSDLPTLSSLGAFTNVLKQIENPLQGQRRLKRTDQKRW